MRTYPILQGLIVGVSLVALWPTAAQARPEYPGAIQEAADMPCVPTCLLCHTVTPGTKSTWTGKPVGNALLGHDLMMGEPDTMQAAWDKIVADSKLPATDPKSTCWTKPGTPPITISCAQIVADVTQGIEPLTKENVCGPTYGCGATVAQRPLSEAKHYNDPAPAIAGALALLGSIFALRRRRQR